MTEAASPAENNCGIIQLTVPNDRAWAERQERLICVMETRFPLIEFTGFESPDDDQGRRINRSERLKQLKRRQRTKLRWFCVTGWSESEDLGPYCPISIGGSTDGRAEPYFASIIRNTTQSPPIDETLLADLCVASGAYTGTMLPMNSWALFNTLAGIGPGRRGDESAVELLSQRLPRILNWSDWRYVAPEQPSNLSWINYWSAATRDFMDFPEDFKDDSLLRHSYEGPEGSVIFKLTEEPLDLTRDDHITCYANALKLFRRFACMPR